MFPHSAASCPARARAMSPIFTGSCKRPPGTSGSRPPWWGTLLAHSTFPLSPSSTRADRVVVPKSKPIAFMAHLLSASGALWLSL